MKKRLTLLLLSLLFVTGCTCEYDLKISNDAYSETVKIIADNNEEIQRLNGKRRIPIDKEVFNNLTKPSTGTKPEYEEYSYELNNNTLTFSHTFDKESIMASTAVSNCYNLLNVNDYESTIIISTSTKLNCFDHYPELNKITVTIEVDKDVISHNADYVNGEKYIWHLDRNSINKKPINMTIDNKYKETQELPDNNSKSNQVIAKKNQKDYTMYIFSGVLLVAMLIGYYIYNRMKNKNKMDD